MKKSKYTPPFYHGSEAAIAGEIASRLMMHLEPMSLVPEAVLNISGVGNHVARDIAARFPKAKLTCRTPFDKIEQISNTYDLVISHVGFQWIDDLALFFNQVKHVLKPNGLFLFSAFGPDTLQECRDSWKSVDGYAHVYPFVDMHDLGDALVHEGFLDPVMEMEVIQFHYGALEGLFQDLKKEGLTHVSKQSRKGLTTPRELNKMKATYRQEFSVNDKMVATFEIIYGHAWVSSHGNNIGKIKNGVVEVPIEALKKISSQ